MTILAIDPGPVKSAYVVWNGTEILEHNIIPNDDMIQVIDDDVTDPELLAIEQIASYGMAVGAEVFETCVWSGRFIEAWSRIWSRHMDCHIIRLPRKDIKLHLCGTTKAKDTNVRQALIDRLGAPGTKAKPGATYGIKADEWAALAVAVTAFDRRKCEM